MRTSGSGVGPGVSVDVGCGVRLGSSCGIAVGSTLSLARSKHPPDANITAIIAKPKAILRSIAVYSKHAARH
jgi:hypothetical protein